MRNLLYILIITLLTGCVEDYNQKGIEEMSDLLVIGGMITDNESVFNIRRSVGLTERITGDEFVSNASVYVEKDNGKTLTGEYIGDGKYVVSTGELDKELKYRLYVKIRDEEYRSEYLSPIFSAEIDEITSDKKGHGQPVNIYIDVNDKNESSRYYKWSFSEIWEVKAEHFANFSYLNGSERQNLTLETSENIYYCWVRDESKTMLLGASDKISDNIIYKKKIHEISAGNTRLSVLYYITVRQNQIRKDAYDYFYVAQKNVEQAGGLFTPIPSEMKGNIKCVSNHNLPVIGFIEVSTTTTKELFLPSNIGYYELASSVCNEGDVTMAPTKDNFEYFYKSETFPYYELYGPQHCYDCRTFNKATKNRPDFWPNNHY